MRCIAIDDEPLALSVIERYVQRFGGLEIKTYSDPIRGLEEVNRLPPDILFLDIEMGVVNGVEAARSLPAGVKLIFTTAYAQFAIDGFDLNAVDFLHKPFSYSRFERAMFKAKQLIDSTAIDDMGEITLKVEYQSVKVCLNHIQYIEAMDNYVKIHLNSQRPLLSQMSMKSIDEQLPKEHFARVHKSFIVTRNMIASYNRTQIQLANGSVIPIGRTYQPLFQEWIKK